LTLKGLLLIGVLKRKAFSKSLEEISKEEMRREESSGLVGMLTRMWLY
jgi:hypothetical protein